MMILRKNRARPFSAAENQARLLFAAHPLDTEPSSPDNPAPVCLAIAGFSDVGREVFLEAVRIGHFSDREPLDLTICDSEAGQWLAETKKQSPDLDRVCRYAFHAAHPSVEDAARISDAWPEPGDSLYAVLAWEDDEANLAWAEAIAEQMTAGQLLVHLSRKGRLPRMRRLQERVRRAGGRAFPFGEVMADDFANLLLEQRRDQLAEALVAIEDPAVSESWARLPPVVRTGFYRRTDFLPVLLRAVNCRLVADDRFGSPLEGFSDSEIELLADMERRRRNAERALAGEELPSSPNRDAERRFIARLPEWIEAAGLHLRRLG